MRNNIPLAPPNPPYKASIGRYRDYAALEIAKTLLGLSDSLSLNGEDIMEASVHLADVLVEKLEMTGQKIDK